MKATIELSELSVITLKRIAREIKDKDILLFLAEESDFSIREAVAKNPSVTNEILSKLSKDINWRVRYAVVNSSNVTTEILSELSEDEVNSIKEFAIKKLM